MKLLTYLLTAIGLASVIIGFVEILGLYSSIFIGIMGGVLLFVAFILWLFKIKKL